jgi:hypothetical protein
MFANNQFSPKWPLIDLWLQYFSSQTNATLIHQSCCCCVYCYSFLFVFSLPEELKGQFMLRPSSVCITEKTKRKIWPHLRGRTYSILNQEMSGNNKYVGRSPLCTLSLSLTILILYCFLILCCVLIVDSRFRLKIVVVVMPQ